MWSDQGRLLIACPLSRDKKEMKERAMTLPERRTFKAEGTPRTKPLSQECA